MRIFSKYIGIIGILIFVVLTSGCSFDGSFQDLTDNSSDDTRSINVYSSNGISFNYPGNWSIRFKKINNSISIISMPNYSFRQSLYSSFGPFVSNVTISSEGTQFEVKIIRNTTMSEHDILQIQDNVLSGDSREISRDILTVDGNKAYREIFITNAGTMRFERIDFVENGNSYTIVFQAPDNYFDKEKQNFEMILNSFKVQ